MPARLVAAPPKRGRFCSLELERGNVRSLESLRTRGHFEFNRLAVVQRLVSLRLNRGEMHENIVAGLALDESEALAGVKPLYCSLFFQLCVSFLFELFGAVSNASGQEKRAARVNLQPFKNV